MTGNDVEYTYGTSGNETGRFLFWTEDCYGCEHRLCQSNEVSNRMHAAVDEKYSSYYVYDHSGERRVKLTGTNDLLDVNADYMYTASVLKEPTIYPSAYMVMSNKGYTKHYYAGAERVAARIGGGGLYVTEQDHRLSDKSGRVFKQSLEQINERLLENNDIDCIANGLFSTDKLAIEMNEVPERLQAELIIEYDEFRPIIDDAQNIHHNEPDVYFYHSDHLGSASWITDNSGLAVQHLQYLPYGERYVDQRAAGYNERFTFTGKERDEETGYGYFGARYMDHELMTMWLSVDPMADKYPSLSPYNYCAWNPVKLVDPDGKELADFFDRQGNYLGNDGKNDGKVYMLKEGFRAKTEDTRINWGGTLDPKHVDQIIASSDEITMNSDIGMLSRLLYSEFRGQSGNEQRVCADIVLNRVDDSKFPNTLEGVITQKQQFSSLNENDKNRKYFDNPSATLNNSSNIEAWRNCVSSAISVSNGYSRGISCDATLYYSPRSMKPKGSMPQWNYKLLKEVYPQGVNSNNIRCFKYK